MSGKVTVNGQLVRRDLPGRLMAAKPKAKRRGRPKLAKEVRREVRSVRLPAAMWERLDAMCAPKASNVTSLIENAVRLWLDGPES